MKKLLLVIFLLLAPSLANAQASKNDLIGLGMAPELANELVKGTVSNSSYIIQVDNDPQRKFTFDATSDTALTMKFGDGTAAQDLSILGTTINGADTQSLCLVPGSSCSGGAGGIIQLFGEQHATSPGLAYIGSADVAGADLQLLGTDDITLVLAKDANRLITFDSSSDTALAMKFGDGSTASQVLTLSAATSDLADNGELHLGGGGAAGQSRGGSVLLYGNESAGGGDAYLRSGVEATSDVLLVPANDLIFQLSQDTNRLITFDASSDTALTMSFGDGGTTASQVFTIAGSAGANDDDSTLALAGGSSADYGEGGYINLLGNEITSTGGSIQIIAGNDADADIILYIEDAASVVSINDTTSGTLWAFENDGDLNSSASLGGNINFNTSGKTLGIEDDTAASTCKGTGTFTGTTAATISTTCAATGAHIIITPTADTGATSCWVTNIVNNTSFDVDCSGANTATFNYTIIKGL